MSKSNRYQPKALEQKWYSYWMEKGYFRSVPDEREPYSIVIPPPNVTGVLHMGHMLNNTVQDILIRKARLDGKNACWVPGTDHASIATEAKVVRMLRERGIKKSDITREEFLEYAFEWKDKYGGIILDQLQKLGASCDWDRTRFTMEPSMSKAVIRVFVDLHQKGKLYRGLRMINWDPAAQTALSNEEVVYKEEQGKLYHVRYQIEGTDKWLTIATTRPETILGDTAVAVHPDDDRYQHLKGKSVIVPVVNRPIPIIFDDYVDLEFGTGALKITPAHDMNDYEIGERHELETIDIFNDDGTLSEAAGHYIGDDRAVARNKIVKDLEASGHLVKIEDYHHKVGRSERTDAFVEPRLKEQWFLDMKEFASEALKAVERKEVRFYPEHFYNMYRSWLQEENVRDWCVSRQLWWGQRIPAWYYGDEVFVAETAEEALVQARKKTGNSELTLDELKQDEDVVDTWFSSQLWPITVFDGFEDPTELKYYYPTNVLVTAWDIIFFWVARMIMMGYEYGEELLGEAHVKEKGTQPFSDVYYTGMVRDNQRRKMSKSLGNSPDALVLLDTYGADGVRFGMLSSAAAGNDIIFDAPIDPETGQVANESKLCAQGLNFCNKMWNALRLIQGWEQTDQVDGTVNAINQLSNRWFEERLQQILQELESDYSQYRLSEGLMRLYNFIWGDFCSWYLEMIKPAYGAPIESATFNTSIALFEQLMIILHPFMPFVTEEIWHLLKERADGEDCIISTYPQKRKPDNKLIADISSAQDLISKVRDLRNQNKLGAKDPLPLVVQSDGSGFWSTAGMQELIKKMAYLESIDFQQEEIEGALDFVVGTTKCFLKVEQHIDIEAEYERLQKELDYARGFVSAVERKLSNERFVNNAPAPVVEKERKKLADGQERIKNLEESLNKLKKMG